MTKLFKNSKQVLAFVFAFAVLAVSLFTGSININADACDVSKIDYWDGTKASNFASGDGTEGDPYIIKTAEQLALACLGQTPETSTGKYYKVDDSVKIFVLQPESVVDLDTLMGLDSAEAVKTYLTGLTGVKNWHSQFNFKSFNGHFDGNGATIYGLYVDTVNTTGSKDDCGLFPQFDGGVKNPDGSITPSECKNIAVKNSYYLSNRRMGGITGAAYGTNYGAKVDGKVIVDNCAVINCYMEGRTQSVNHYSEQGIVVGGGGLDIVEINNILVKGTYAYDTVQGKNIPIIGASSSVKVVDPADATKQIYQTKVTNSVFLGVAPYQKDYYVDHLCQEYIFSNVITDAAAGKVTITNPAGWGSATSTRNYAEEQIKQVTATGFDFKAAASTLDWEDTWFMSEDGPELRDFHGEITLDQTATTHVWECADCGLTSPGGVADHEWVEESEGVFTCSVCEYTCRHNSLNTYDDPGDCVTDPGTYTVCDYCKYTTVIPAGKAPGHSLTYVPADAGDCETEGHAEYWYCDVCENKFTTEDDAAAMDSAVTDADLNTGLGIHPLTEDEDGVVVMYDENGHWYTCSIDGGRIDYDSNVLEDGVVVAHDYQNAVCIDCGYECKEHDYEATGKVAVVGDCFTDEELEIKCNICNFKSTVVSVPAAHKIVKVEEVPANDRMEGTKAHYICEICKSIYADAEGKTSVTKASLIIPKVLPAEYQNTVSGTVNADTSNKSPSTGDNLVSVVAVAALAGAAFVIARKSK